SRLLVGTEEVILSMGAGVSWGHFLLEPGDPKADISTAGSKPTRADKFAILPQDLLKATVKLASLLKGLDEEWAIGGDAGELVQGVNVPADHLEILTTKKGCEAISARL